MKQQHSKKEIKTTGKVRGVSEQQTTTMQESAGLVTQVVGINSDKQVRTFRHCIDASRRYSSAKSKEGGRGAEQNVMSRPQVRLQAVAHSGHATCFLYFNQQQGLHDEKPRRRTECVGPREHLRLLLLKKHAKRSKPITVFKKAAAAVWVRSLCKSCLTKVCISQVQSRTSVTQTAFKTAETTAAERLRHAMPTHSQHAGHQLISFKAAPTSK